MNQKIVFSALLLAACTTTPPIVKPVYTPEPAPTVPAANYGTTESWLKEGKASIASALEQVPNTKQAKNIIVFVGDGMGISTITAARILEGQMKGKPGEENRLSFENFPYTALVKTYNVDAQVSDSAGTATAINTGVKTRKGSINTAPSHPRGRCEGMLENAPTPMATYVEKLGMSTGIVTTTRLTHATPAAVYAHSPERGWEADSDLPEDALTAGCRDIAQQLLDHLGGDGVDVVLGGGRRNFLPETEGGKRADTRNIITEWLSSRQKAAYVDTADALASINYEATQKLLGIFASSHMSYEDRRPNHEPDLATMTEAAIKLLSKNEKGYYLMVEAGRIDHGHHEGNAHKALHDAVALSAAVRKTLELVNTEDTLVLVTADHSHTFTVAGYPRRGNPIFGLVREQDGKLAETMDGKPYTTLGYINGPGAVNGERPYVTDSEAEHHDYHQHSLVPLMYETHGGEDVALFAKGPWAHLARGTIEQNVIFHLIDHALKLRERAAKVK